MKSDQLVVIGAPVYAGRVTPLAAQRLKELKGDATPTILVVLYCNREYEELYTRARSKV